MKPSARRLLLTGFSILLLTKVYSQQDVKFVKVDSLQKVDVIIGGKPFTSYLYSDKIDKPVLYPINTASGITVTRGFPLNPRAGERTDHPHHIGLWFNYGDVNGLDFWNNSYAIKQEDKPKFGSVRHRRVVKAESGKKRGMLVVEADWVNHLGETLLKEQTTLVFSGGEKDRTIERSSTLTAQNKKVFLKDNKEGMLAIRVARELEIPTTKPEIFTDAQGNPTKVPALNNVGVAGNYVSSEGKTGDEVWGTRGKWCMMYSKVKGEPVSITIVDHPSNPGYPTYWHARGYGLFAANPLGQEALSGGKEKLNYSLDPARSATFRYKVIINNGTTPAVVELNRQAEEFAKQP